MKSSMTPVEPPWASWIIPHDDGNATLREYVRYKSQTYIHPDDDARTHHVKRVLTQYPDLDVNWSDSDKDGGTPLLRGCTPLFKACRNGDLSVVKMLLAYPGIDVNKPDIDGYTPLIMACCNVSEGANVDVVRYMLSDSRVTINPEASCGATPFFEAIHNGLVNIAKLLIADGRPISMGTILERHGPDGTWTWRQGYVTPLLAEFEADEAATRERVRLELGYYTKLIAKLFSLVLFICEGLLVAPSLQANEHLRFFRIVSQLPMELQMIICNRAYKQSTDSILSKDTEHGWREVGRMFGAIMPLPEEQE